MGEPASTEISKPIGRIRQIPSPLDRIPAFEHEVLPGPLFTERRRARLNPRFGVAPVPLSRRMCFSLAHGLLPSTRYAKQGIKRLAAARITGHCMLAQNRSRMRRWRRVAKSKWPVSRIQAYIACLIGRRIFGSSAHDGLENDLRNVCRNAWETVGL